jgi:hypothetical protein
MDGEIIGILLLLLIVCGVGSLGNGGSSGVKINKRPTTPKPDTPPPSRPVKRREK